MLALERIVNMEFPKKKSLMKAFITSLFRFCSLIWMLHSRSLNNPINDIHEKALRLPYKEKPVFIYRYPRKRPFCDSSFETSYTF